MSRNKEKMTIEKIAKKLGVATCTVSKALNNATDVSEKTRKKVLDYTSSIGFSLKKKNSISKFCVIIANSNSCGKDYSTFKGFQMAAKKNHTEVIVETYSQGDNFDFNDYLTKKKVDGVFIIGNTDSKLAAQLVASRFPTVLADSLLPVENVSETDTDFARSFSDMVNHLFSLGHTRIGFLNQSDRGEKFAGFVAGMLSNNLLINKDSIVRAAFDAETSGYESANAFFNRCTAVICASDVLAAGLIRGFNDMGVKVPDEISVTGFGDTKIASFFTPKITSIKINYTLMGQTAYGVLSDLACGGVPKRILLNGEIIPRESTGRIKQI